MDCSSNEKKNYFFRMNIGSSQTYAGVPIYGWFFTIAVSIQFDLPWSIDILTIDVRRSIHRLAQFLPIL